MTTFDASLLSPPSPREDVYPYRRVWRTTAYETGILIAGALAVNLVGSLLDVHLDVRQRPLVTALLALMPLALWLLFSYRGEQRARRPRKGLLPILVVSILAANAATTPFVDEVIAPETWLSTASGLVRILGYTLTVGLAFEFSKYLILRVMAWPKRFERRIDAVAYSLVVSLAFATVLNLRFALLDGGGQPGAAALRIVSTVLVQQAAGLVVAYRLMVLKFGTPRLFSLALSLLAGSFLIGFHTAFRAGLTVGSFGVGATGNTPLLGFGFSVAFGVAVFALFAFLIATAEARDVRPAGPRRR